MTTGEKIKMLRVKKGMSQEELGKKVGVHCSVVSTKQPQNSGTQKVPESVENQCFRGFFHTFLSMA